MEARKSELTYYSKIQAFTNAIAYSFCYGTIYINFVKKCHLLDVPYEAICKATQNMASPRGFEPLFSP